MAVTQGLEAEVEHVITDTDTARSLGSGDLDVLGTPAVVALCEAAAVAAVAGSLEPGHTSVGTNITMDHIAPTIVGRRIIAHARLERVEGRTLHFEIEANDDSGAIARGSHVRVIVDRDRFTASAAERAR
jgi:predicted thioesterase